MKFAAFFGKLWLKTQSVTKKVWALAKLHKVVSIATAATVVAGTTCAIALPIALHNHKYSSEWTSDAISHWHEATCKHEEERSDVANHTYSGACDVDCDVCGKVRSVPHAYDNECDTVCNICGGTREQVAHVFFNICDTDCNICGTVREVGVHLYDNSCDTVCNACGDVRSITHTFDNVCDTTCNVCDYTRSTLHTYMLATGNDTQHWYECTGCGDAINAKNHRYDNDCDTTCNDCGRERTIEHSYATDMYRNADKHWYECVVCGEKKGEGAHYYTNDCDTSCDACSATRVVGPHVYDNDCDTTCNICNGVRDIEHAYELVNDDNSHWYECSVCQVTKDSKIHIYSHSCDHTCNECNFVREVEDHPYEDTYSYDLYTHWYECFVCKERKDVAPHVYTNDCDTTCNDCGAVRKVGPHIYDNDCDTACNICDAVREVAPHPYATTYTYDTEKHWFVCEECGDITGVAAHEYDNACETTCNDCDYVRTVDPPHIYDNDCDTACNICNAIREVEPHPYETTYTYDAANHWYVCEECGDKKDVANHKYDNACDTTCNDCGYVLTVGPHLYDNNCDTTCNICDAVREVEPHPYATDYTYDAANHWLVCEECGDKKDVAEHKYDNACDTDCNVCGMTREVPAHVYDNACDKNCNVCDAAREVPAHVYDNACDKTCNVCDAVREVPAHVYDNACDTTCNVCGDVRVTEHKFDSCEDTVCNVCGDVREAVEHDYGGPCNEKCINCGFVRDGVAIPHDYDRTTYITDGEYHWYKCSNCPDITEKAAHDDAKATDDWYHWSRCSVCGYEKDDVGEHDYSDVLTSDDDKHWYECTGCDTRRGESDHGAYVPFEDATHHWEGCIDCGHKKNVEAHDFPDDYETDGDKHWKDCTVCGYRDEEEHNYPDEFKSDYDKHWKDCTVCSYRDEEEHNKSLTYDEERHWYECEVCAGKYDSQTHRFTMEIEDEKYLHAPATDTTEAVYYKVCRNCDQHGGEDDVWTKKKNDSSITIHVSDKIYDGDPLTFLPTTTSDGEIEVWYKSESDADFIPYTAGVIVGAGKYTIKVTTPQTIEYYAGEATAEVTIEKATLALKWTTPNSVYDQTDKTASVEIESGIIGSDNVSVIAQLVSGNTKKPNQIIVYKVILSGVDAANYVIKSGDETVTYEIDPCTHPAEHMDNVGNCDYCGEYAGTTQDCGDSWILLDAEQIAATDVLYCRFKATDKSENLGYYIVYGREDGVLSDKFTTFTAYVKDGDGFKTIRLRENRANVALDIYGEYIYMVISLDDSMSLLKFTIQYKPVE